MPRRNKREKQREPDEQRNFSRPRTEVSPMDTYGVNHVGAPNSRKLRNTASKLNDQIRNARDDESD